MSHTRRPAGPLVEELESRLLFSADLDGLVPLVAPREQTAAALTPEGAQAAWEQTAQASHQQPSGGQHQVSRELVILDWRVGDVAGWREAVQAEAERSGRSIELIVLSADQGGIAQITALLAGREGLTAVHIVSHGDAQGLSLGSDRLDAASLLAQAGDVAGWASALHPDADVLLYGCDLASDQAGRSLLDDLAVLTGADVAASVDRTGAAVLGGNWELEHHVGAVNTALAVGLDFQVSWQQVLPTLTFRDGENGYTGTEDTALEQLGPNNNNSADTVLYAGRSGTYDAYQILFKFNDVVGGGASQIPQGATVTDVRLVLTITDQSTFSNPTFSINRMLVSWSDTSTWSSMGSGVDGSEARLIADVTLAESGNKTYTVGSTAALVATVQGWVNDPSTNHGWYIFNDDYSSRVGFASSEAATVAQRPRLEVTYTLPTPPSLDLDANNSSGAAGVNYNGSYTEGTPAPIADIADATVTAGAGALTGMTITLTNRPDGALESLSFNPGATPITGAYDAATGVLALSGNATAAQYQEVLRSVRYDNASDNPASATRTISVTVTDQYGQTASATSSLTVTGVNDAPVITSNGGGSTAFVSVQENRTLVTTVTASDPEGTAVSYSISGGADAARFSITAAGVLSFTSAPDFENPTDSNSDNVYEVNVRASDGSLFAVQTLYVTVTDVSNVLVVDTTADTNDSGLGSSFTIEQLNASKGADGRVSLREALIAANNTAGLDVITFNLTGATGAYGEYTFFINTTLPSITDAVYLNAASQPGYLGQPRIVLDGEGGAGNGFTLTGTADGSTIRGFVIRDFGGDGIHIQSGSDNHTIVGNYIGSFHADGSNAGVGERNASSGIQSYGANVTIGGTTAEDRNVISGNVSAYNIYLASGANGTTILGNYIGTDAAGSTAFTTTNGTHGIMVETSATQVTIGGTAAGAGNVISGFSNRGIWARPRAR